MLRFFLGVLLLLAGSGALTGLYLLVRHFHRKWKWQDQVNENAMRRAILEEADIQFEVGPDGFVRPVKRKERERVGLG
jgi:hypothetical protein